MHAYVNKSRDSGGSEKVNKGQNVMTIWYRQTLEVPTLNFSSGPGQQAGQQCGQQEEESWGHWPHRAHCLQFSIWSILKQMTSQLNWGLMFSLYQRSIMGNQIHTTSNCTRYVQSCNSISKFSALQVYLTGFQQTGNICMHDATDFVRGFCHVSLESIYTKQTYCISTSSQIGYET